MPRTFSAYTDPITAYSAANVQAWHQRLQQRLALKAFSI